MSNILTLDGCCIKCQINMLTETRHLFKTKIFQTFKNLQWTVTNKKCKTVYTIRTITRWKKNTEMKGAKAIK